MYHATVAYKQWARKRYEELGHSLESLAQAIKRIDSTLPASSGGLAQFFRRKDETPEPSNTALLPAMNQVLGIPPPPVCQPDDEVSQLLDAIRARLETMTQAELDLLRLSFGLPPRAK